MINFSLFLCEAITIEPEIQNITKDPIVGHPYEIQCIVEEVSINFGNIKWIGPRGEAFVSNSRINITYTTVGNNHSSILQFAYLKETDIGWYNCCVEIPYNITYNITYNDSIMLEDFMSKLTFLLFNYKSIAVHSSYMVIQLVLNAFVYGGK